MPLPCQPSHSPPYSSGSPRLHYSASIEVSSSFTPPANPTRCVFLGVDAGTGRARAAVKAAFSSSKVRDGEVKGMGFAATCSLVALDADSVPVSVSLTDDSRRNVIVWMDHRARSS